MRMPLKSLIGDNMRLQLQHLERIRGPASILTAFILLSGIPLLRRGPTAPLSAVVATLDKATPGLAKFVSAFIKVLTTTCLRVRIHVQIPPYLRRVFEIMNHRQRSPRNDDMYLTPRAEAKYWRTASRYRRRLYSAENGASSLESGNVALVTYYTPRLLPLYRESEQRRARRLWMDVEERPISPRIFCKWHRMVFRGSHHPTLAQAAARMKYHSDQDLREMRRIARLLPDEQVFRARGKAKWTDKYRNMWRKWLENKEVDLVIVFADD